MINLILIVMGTVLSVLSICVITLLCKAEKQDKKTKYKPLIGSIVIGGALPVLFLSYLFEQATAYLLMSALLSEILLLVIFCMQRLDNTNRRMDYYDDGTAPKYYITGDKHRHFKRIKDFCRDVDTRRKDVVIVLGDAGFNYYDDRRDDKLKAEISELPITLFCLHGNKENRPQHVGTYGIRSFCGGKVYYEPKYPNIYFAIDGEVYTFEGKKYIVVGGAHSVDKQLCLEEGHPYWEDEMPDEEIKRRVEEQLCRENNRIFGFLTHTCPVTYLPTEMFMSTRENAAVKRKPRKAKRKKVFHPDIDRSTEIWLDELEKKVEYTVWFCGHYHIDKRLEKVVMLYEQIRPLHMRTDCDEIEEK